jgi:predicted nucleic acid-binding protein
VACRDPKDDKFLSLAVCGRATHLVTGDADLLALNPFEGIRIVTPRQFLEI